MALREDADVETSSEATRGASPGAVGDFFLEVQARATLELLARLAAGAVLDVGGGHGQLTGPLVEAGYAVDGARQRPTPAASARVRVDGAGRARFQAGDLLALPFPDRSFDVVLAFRLLPHVARWARAGGRAVPRGAPRGRVVDYPTRRSVNAGVGVCSSASSRASKATRGRSRCSATPRSRPRSRPHGFHATGRRPQFFFPMALHRALGVAPRRATASKAAASGAGPDAALGSPVILRLERAWLNAEPARPGRCALFRRSVLKQRKLAEIVARAGPHARACAASTWAPTTASISLLLRERGGDWASADLTEEAVASIRGLVGSDVHQVDGVRLPFRDAEFDRVVVVDMLEHVPDEAAFVARAGARHEARAAGWSSTRRISSTRCCGGLRHALGPDRREARPPAPWLHARAACASCWRPDFALESAPHLLALLLGAGGHRDQLGRRAPGQEGLGQGHGGDGGDLARHAQLFRAYSARLPVRLGGLAPRRAHPLGLGLHADRARHQTRAERVAPNA